MNIFVIGGGGREHALVWKLKQNKSSPKIFCCPGNGGIQQEAEIVNIDVNDFNSIADFAEEKSIDLTVVGPEAPLVGGIVNLFNERGLKVFGPVKEAAFLKTELTSPDQQRLHNLIADLEVILLQIANLESQIDVDGIEMVKSGVDRRGILLKINLEEMETKIKSSTKLNDAAESQKNKI